jgi:hypothetical protein
VNGPGEWVRIAAQGDGNIAHRREATGGFAFALLNGA